MIPISAIDIITITNGFCDKIYFSKIKNLIIRSIVTNSNEKSIDSLFIALKGKNFDGHFFVKSAINSGVKLLLLNKSCNILFPQIIVQDTRVAMLKIASWLRKQSNAKVVAITGSVGKTTVKEMVSRILEKLGSTLFNEKNFNNDIGVCKTLFSLSKKHKFIVIEIGANHIGEIKILSGIIKPNVVLINNLFISHLDGFGSFKGISKSKSEIFSGLVKKGIVIINYHNNDFLKWRLFLTDYIVLFFSLCKKKNTHFYAKNIFIKQTSSEFDFCTSIGCIRIKLSLIGMHNILNSLAAGALAFSVGANLKQINLGLNNISYISGRMYPIYLSKKKILLDDTYNSNIGSMISAAEVLFKMPGYRIFVSSDMSELGKKSKKYHKEIGKIIDNKNFEEVLTFGKYSYLISKINKYGKHFYSKKELILKLIHLIKKNKVVSILIKGSRNMKMEEIVQYIIGYFLC